MKYKNITMALIAGILVLFVIGLVSAAPKDIGIGAKANVGVNVKSSEVNMTYGQCVSQYAEAKNSCYVQVKDALETCKGMAGEDSAKVKICKDNYKRDMKQCKVDFKESKKICKQYKKTMMDRVKFWR